MLSISNITSKHAANYYSNGDYYTKDNNTKIIGEWYGKIAERLNLNNKPFEKTDFENILNLNGRTKIVDSGKLIVDSYNKLKIENYNKLKTGSLNNGINNNTNNNNNKPRAKRACGIDLTFSAPKSVSIVCELQDKAIAKIHQNAVKNTLSYIEDNFIFTRTQKTYKQEHNILATLFLHNTSRELDPQLHTHCILHNIVLDENNDSSKNNNNNNNKVRSAYFKDIFNNKKFLGSIYRNELAKGLIKAGYEIEFQDNKFNFEIKGVSPELIKTFSTRRQQIEAKLKESISTVINGKISAKATLLTRKAKEKQINETLLKKLWEDKAKDFDLSHLKNNKAIDINNDINNDISKDISKDNDINRDRDTINNINNNIQQNTKGIITTDKSITTIQQYANNPITNLNKDRDINNNINNINYLSSSFNNVSLKDIVQNTFNHIAERKAVFTKQEVMQGIIKNTFGKFSIKEIENALKLQHNIYYNALTREYTTAKQYIKEDSVINLIKQTQNTFSKILTNTNDNLLERVRTNDKTLYNTLTKEQQNAINFILKNTDQFIAIQGYAGVGKTRTIQALSETLNIVSNYKLLGLAPTNNATNILKNEIGIEAQTLQSFLKQYDGYANNRGTEQGLKQIREKYFRNTIILLDESSLADTQQIKDLLTIADKLKVRVILQGDKIQLDSINAGTPFKQLQDKNIINMAELTNIQRQSNKELKEAVYDVINKDIKGTFTKLEKTNSIVDLGNNHTMNLNNNHITDLNKDGDVNNNVNNNISKDNDINKVRDINKDNNIINNNTINSNQNKDINNNNNSNIKINIKDNINNNIKQAIVEATVQEYLKLDKQQREQTLILAPANETRTAINNLLREKLRKEYELDKSYNKELENNHNNNNTIYSINNNNSNNNNKLQKQTIFERIKNLFTNKELTDITINTLQQKPLTELEKKDIKNYNINDKLIFNRDFENYNIKKQKEYNIIGIDNKTNSLLITSDISNSNNNCNYNKDINNSNDNKDISNNSNNNHNKEINNNTNTNNRRNEIKLDIDKAKDFDVFETKQLPLQKYEELKWTRTIKEQDIFKHTELQLVKITEKYLVFKNKEDINLNKDRNKNKTKNNNNNNKEIILKYNNLLLKYLDYNYTTTTYSAQGRTSNNVIVALESYRTNLTNQKSFYVELSRARENITIITDDKDKLLNQLIKNTGEKTNAMDILDKERTTESVKDRMTLKVDSGNLIVDSYNKLKADSLDNAESNKVKTANDLNIKSNSNLNNSKDIGSKGIKKDMGFEIEM